MNIEESDLLGAIRAAGDQLVDFHVADNNRMPPGHGALDWEAIVRELQSDRLRRLPDGRVRRLGRPHAACPSGSTSATRPRPAAASGSRSSCATTPPAPCPRRCTSATRRTRSSTCARRSAPRSQEPMPAVALIGTLDTKGDEIAYVRERLIALRRGRRSSIDSGILGEPDCAADISREEVAAAGGHELDGGPPRRLARRGRVADAARACARSSRGCSPTGGSRACCAWAARRARCSARRRCRRCRSACRSCWCRPRASGRRAFARVRRRERRLRHALGRRHPRAQRHLAADLRQRRGGDGGHGPRRRLRARDARRALRRDHDARADDAGRDAPARGAGRRRARAGDLPRQRRRRAGDGAPVRGGRAAAA